MKGTWEVVHVLYARADNGTGMITCQTGDVHSGEVSDPEAVMFHSPGVLSLPAAPDPGVDAPEGVALKTTAGDVVLVCRNVRTGEIAGLIQQGETAVFADGSRASVLCKLDGSVRLVTTHDNTANGRTIAATVAPTGVDLSTPWSRLTLGDLGIHAHCVRSDGSAGAYFDLGSVAGLPAPFDSMGTYLTMGANLVRVEGQTISLGTDTGTAEPVAKATTLIGVLTALSSALSNLSSVLSALTTPTALATPTQPVSATPTFVAALGAAISAISAATSAITTASAGAAPGPVLSLASQNVTVT